MDWAELPPLTRRRVLMSAAFSVPAVRLLGGQFKPQNPPPPGQTAPKTAVPNPPGSPTPTYSSNVKVVNVFATVRDKQGHIVRNLSKDDFTIEEDSRPQTIRYFAQQSDVPLTLGLLVDTSMSERRMLPQERDASYTFFQQILRPDKDKAFLIHFDHDVELLQDLTSSRERLEKALDLLGKPEWGAGNGQSGGSGGGNDTSRGGNGGYGGGGYGGGGYGRHRGGYGGGGHGTAFYDAIYLASDDLMSKQTGRKALVMLTDGEDNASKVSLDEAIRTAQHADTLGYSVCIADEEQQGFPGAFGGPGMGRHGGWGGPGGGRGGYGSHTDGKKVLQQISKQTGGAYFEVSKKKTVDQIYSEIEDELRNQYSLGYTSDKPDTEAGYRKIQVTVKQKDCTVQARDGYFAGA